MEERTYQKLFFLAGGWRRGRRRARGERVRAEERGAEHAQDQSEMISLAGGRRARTVGGRGQRPRLLGSPIFNI